MRFYRVPFTRKMNAFVSKAQSILAKGIYVLNLIIPVVDACFSIFSTVPELYNIIIPNHTLKICGRQSASRVRLLYSFMVIWQFKFNGCNVSSGLYQINTLPFVFSCFCIPFLNITSVRTLQFS